MSAVYAKESVLLTKNAAGAGKPKTVQEYEIAFSNGDHLSTRAPRDWQSQGWNGSHWVTLDKRINEVGWDINDTRRYTLANPSSYSMYRLYITEDNDP